MCSMSHRVVLLCKSENSAVLLFTHCIKSENCIDVIYLFKNWFILTVIQKGIEAPEVTYLYI